MAESSERQSLMQTHKSREVEMACRTTVLLFRASGNCRKLRCLCKHVYKATRLPGREFSDQKLKTG
jgi:hypothetical protein